MGAAFPYVLWWHWSRTLSNDPAPLVTVEAHDLYQNDCPQRTKAHCYTALKVQKILKAYVGCDPFKNALELGVSPMIAVSDWLQFCGRAQ